ncbi:MULTISPECIES: acyl-ACP--UDP-N-acetylglucosamine O-acyltransferase [Leptospirillum]|uniref:Acyl-(Acyl carrier protein)--UDP-N-acetylglucosamine O-acyltransferase n=1 Tax=Leptospirillum ferriphilum (strain ML-04) TaxID=1048260 RepID=J9ZCP3_LEPFM|nr:MULTISPECIES: acyl-ACP--UDP-N-acetylglucosamine O-acyltransferase [Leptospirillum]AFS53517.1 acyl-(acyl carrier protein)--UDP-N-acetylglucosamine O-acyltransferase [Leptospirillum ferriphilum ML-04]EAY56285.1 MAG: Acyl-(Acyl-carrier-protein)--UDP-N-acetylglucosamine O-acyltransferase [Leptospirillum rubarum]EIJ76990.1 MAG: Acyl-(Acyl-carrier-protein)--UDP-N- acetylglucosamine O-acyltransferase [Leptospirillum sp. Group II 'C75']
MGDIRIHPTAILEGDVELGNDVTIGPYCVLRGPCRIGSRTVLFERVSIAPGVILGEDNRVHMGAVIGHEPQDHAYQGAITTTRIGNSNEIREYATIHRATKEGTETRIGDHNLLMAQSHVAHNCQLGDRVILANGALLAGHVIVENQVFVSGAVLIHQFVRIGRLSLLRGGARTSRDVPPFCIIDGTHTVRTLNRIGLRRAGYTSGEIGALRANFRKIFLNRSLDRALLSRLLSEGDVLTREMAKFILESKRGVCQSRVSIDKNAGSEYD